MNARGGTSSKRATRCAGRIKMESIVKHNRSATGKVKEGWNLLCPGVPEVYFYWMHGS